MTRRPLTILPMLAASLAPLAAQSVARRVETAWNCLQLPDGDRLAAPVLRLVMAEDRAAVAQALMAKCVGPRADELRHALFAAATLAPEFGVALLDAGGTDLVLQSSEDEWELPFLLAVEPLADAVHTSQVLDQMRASYSKVRGLIAGSPRFLDCWFRYELRLVTQASKTPAERLARLRQLCWHRELATLACAWIAGDAGSDAVVERLLQEHDRDDDNAGAVVVSAIGRAWDRDAKSPWCDDPVLPQLRLLAGRYPFSRPGRWGLLAIVFDKATGAAARGAALQQLMQQPPRADEWRLVTLLAQRMADEPATTVRAFLGWVSLAEDLEAAAWPVRDAASAWPPELREACLRAFGRWRSPRDEVVAAIAGSAPATLVLGSDLAIECIGQRLQRLAQSLQHPPASPLSEAAAEARWTLVYGPWRDLAEVEPPQELAVRLDRHLAELRSDVAAPVGLLPRLLWCCLQREGRGEALARAVGLAVLAGTDSGELHQESVPRWTGRALPAGSRIVVGDAAAAWQALAAIARDTPFAFGLDPVGPDWAVAAKFAARDRGHAMSLDDVLAMASLWTEPGALTQAKWDGQRLFAPVVERGAGDGDFVLTPSP